MIKLVYLWSETGIRAYDAFHRRKVTLDNNENIPTSPQKTSFNECWREHAHSQHCAGMNWLGRGTNAAATVAKIEVYQLWKFSGNSNYEFWEDRESLIHKSDDNVAEEEVRT